jgi:hypothetical protein
MKRMIAAFGALLAVTSGMEKALAHHSFAVHFVAGEIVTVSGVVTEFRFRNPHGLVFFAVEGDNGAETWRAETNSPNVLRRRGWSASSIAVGDRITVEGYPSRDDSKTMRIARVIFADGRELIGQRPAAGVASGEED